MGRPLPTGLGPALDEARVEPALAAALAGRLGPRVRAVKGSILKRRTLRYELELADGARLAVVGKVYESRAAGERGFAALDWLHARGFDARAASPVAVPRPLAYLPELALLLMEEVGGRSLQRLLKDGAARPEQLVSFARALLALHGLPDVFGARFTLDDHLAVRCAGLSAELARAFPALARPIERVLASARRAEEGELAPECTVAHGDCHAGQVHVDGTRLWLVDLDLLHQGDPAYDLAMVLFALKRAQTANGDEGAHAALREAFLAAYFERADPRRAARVPLDLALIFLKRACKRFRWRDEERWEDAVRRQIGAAEECIDWFEAAPVCRSLADVLALGARCPAPY